MAIWKGIKKFYAYDKHKFRRVAILRGKEALLWRTWGDEAILGNVLFLMLDIGYTGHEYILFKHFVHQKYSDIVHSDIDL